ncbi:ctenidin-1-like [Ischnura elegans]|uniref:ctenidin-1-like n=1 Tax=Ischnura elegans TaxID=197161 RepID=UPI001ED8A028|nr:ctenidin-1-like [Ischnura elegans]
MARAEEGRKGKSEKEFRKDARCEEDGVVGGGKGGGGCVTERWGGPGVYKNNKQRRQREGEEEEGSRRRRSGGKGSHGGPRRRGGLEEGKGAAPFGGSTGGWREGSRPDAGGGKELREAEVDYTERDLSEGKGG